MPESPEEYFRRISDRVEDLILTAYPNPKRIGCPGEKRVKEVAARSSLIKDEHWEHITHCSPCYAEFIEYKKDGRLQFPPADSNFQALDKDLNKSTSGTEVKEGAYVD